MARKKAVKRSTKPKKNSAKIENDCGPAGYGNIPPGFAPIPSGFPGACLTGQQISDTQTLFDNLRWYVISNDRQLLSQLFVEIGLIQTIVCVPIDDALRGGITFKSKQLDENQIKDLSISMDRDDDLQTCGWAAKWNRLYGGAGILILVDDQDPTTPLDLNAIGPDTEIEFRDVDMWELFWDKQNIEGYDFEIQSQDFEYYSYYSKDLHKSRVMRLKGLKAPSFVRPRLRGWGMSVVEALVRSINQYLKATDVTFEVIDEFKVDYYKIKNLVNTLLNPNAPAAVANRVAMANWQKNYQNAVVMDSEDEWDHKEMNFTGLSDVMAGIRMQVAADMRMPITKLFGTSVSNGFSTDQNDMENYNSMVEDVRNKLKYDILRIAEIKCQKHFGFIPDDLEIEFKPLRELTAVDQETVKTAKFNRLQEALTTGSINMQQYLDACNKGNLFDIQLDTPKDGLDIDNPDIAEDDAQEEPDRNPQVDKDIDDPGANREDTRKVDVGDVEGSKLAKNGFPILNALRSLFNSVAYEKAAFEAEHGEGEYDDRAKSMYSHPSDRELWSAAERASMKAYGNMNWKFAAWFYEKNGGKFE